MGFKLSGEVQTLLDAQWDGGVVTEPAYVVGEVFGNTRKVGTLYLIERPGSYDLDAKTSFPRPRDRFCEIFAVAGSESDLELYLEQIEKHITAKEVVSGHWTLTAWDFSQQSTKFMAEAVIHENKWVIPGTW